MAGKNRNLWYLLCRALGVLPTGLFHNVVGWIMHKRFGIKYHWMNINNPVTFSEKLQYLKKHPVSNNACNLADKYYVREFIKERIGEEYLVPIIGVYNNVEDIDFSMLPNQFVLKLTKGSGYNLICQNKENLDIEHTKKMLRQWLNVDVYKFSREEQYKGKSMLLCEEMLEYNITDYKFFCFGGKPTYVELYMDRFGEHKKAFYDMQWNKMPFTTAGDTCNIDIEQPKEFEDMRMIASELAKGLSFVRVDLYVHNNKVYFGEMTFCPAGGYTPITPREWDFKLGEQIVL